MRGCRGWARACAWRVVLAIACIACLGAPRAQAPDPSSDLIAGYYRSILGREPDAAGVAFWQAQSALVVGLGANVNETWRALALQFLQSPELRARNLTNADYVRLLYRTFLGRSPEAAGEAFWVAQLVAGIPRDAALIDFLFSPEFDAFTRSRFGDARARAEVDMVVDFYRGLLDRLPDPDGMRFWLARFRQAQCSGSAANVAGTAEAISRSFVGSAEYVARRRTNPGFVADMYNAFLRRGPDLAGVLFWTERQDSGALTRQRVRELFVTSPEFQARVQAVIAQGCIPLAESSDAAVAAVAPGPSPFIARLRLSGQALARVVQATFSIGPKAGATARPLTVTYATAYLAANGAWSEATGFVLPVFGLYAGHANGVSIDLRFDDGSIKRLSASVATPAWVDPNAVHDRPQVVQKRASGTVLDFDYVMLKPWIAAPVIVDSDGEVRWWVPSDLVTLSTAFVGDGFLLGDERSTRLRRIRFDGTTSEVTVAAPFVAFHHNIDPGKHGLLVEVDEAAGEVLNLENVLYEIDASGRVLERWDLGALIAAHMRAAGDDPSTLVRPGIDWFHMNAATYDARDDSLILSSREQFLVKIDYQTGALKWILGDPAKQWFAYPSLRALAITLPVGDRYPIGQHAVSVTRDGLVMVFNNGQASLNEAEGAPAGEQRTFSAVSGYAIDPAARTAREALRYDAGEALFSPFCSSAYEAGESLLVNYALLPGAFARIVALDEQLQVVFALQYRNPTGSCQASWNAVPLALHALQVQ